MVADVVGAWICIGTLFLRVATFFGDGVADVCCAGVAIATTIVAPASFTVRNRHIGACSVVAIACIQRARRSVSTSVFQVEAGSRDFIAVESTFV